MKKEVLNIPQENPSQKENQKRKSNVDLYEAIGKESSGPVASDVSNPLDELDQFSTPEAQDNSERQNSKPQQNPFEIPEPPSRPSSDDYFMPRSPNYPESSIQPSRGFSSQPTISTDMVQQITESIVEEKWDELMDKVGDLRLWKEKINSDIGSVKQEILRTQNRFENLQKAVLGKVHDYNENIININNEMKALEKVFEKILQPLTENVKELSKITDKLKKK